MYETGSYLILTAISPNLWDDYLVFYDSIRKFGIYPIVIIDLELTSHQRTHLNRQVNIKRIDYTEKEIASLDECWQKWLKPYYINKCVIKYQPDHLLWLDVDLVVLHSLDELWKHINKQFLVIQDYFAPATCTNNPKLYEKYPCEPTERVLNSGVVGFKFPRDQYILDAWLSKTEIIVSDKEAQQWIKLFDQGILLWALQDLKQLNLIHSNKRWNCPAKKCPYELHTNSKRLGEQDFQWPSDELMGGDILDNIRLDNIEDDPIIAHFAGVPKLSDLCELDNKRSVAYFHEKRDGMATRRVFCVGLERAGTHTIAQLLRRSSTIETWIRHEHRPPLAQEALLKFQGEEYRTEEFEDRLRKYKRSDCGIVCESNHRLGFFIEDIAQEIKNSSFILMLRNPIKLIKSRLLNFATWPNYWDQLPGFYRFDRYELFWRFGIGSPDQNQYRIRPKNFAKMSPLDMHLWEVKETLEIILQQLQYVPKSRYKIIWLDRLSEYILPLAQWIGEDVINYGRLRDLSNQCFGKQCIKTRPETREWVEQIINTNTLKIIKEVSEVLAKYEIDTYDLLTLI